MRLIDRYLVRELLGPCLLGLLVWTCIFEFNWFFRLADQWVAGTLEGREVLEALGYVLPSVLAQTIPMSVLFGVLIGFARLSADGEITALRASGVSYYRGLFATGLVAALACGLSALVYVRLVPWSNLRYQELTARAYSRADLNREIRPGTWTQLAERGVMQSGSLFARGVDASNPAERWLLDVDVLFVDRQARQGEYWRAERARVSRVNTEEEASRLRFVAKEVHRIWWKYDAPEDGIQVQVSETDERLGAEQKSPTEVSVKRMAKDYRAKTLDELRRGLASYAEMDRLDELAKRDPRAFDLARAELKDPWVPSGTPRLRARRYTAMEIHKKAAIPAACLVLAACAMPLGIALRRGGRPASFAISIAVILAWWIVYSVAETWVVAGRVAPAFGAWLPDAVIGMVAVYLLVRLRRVQGLGVYRALMDAQLLGALIVGLLAAVLWFEKGAQERRGVQVPEFPSWLPAVGGALLAGHVLFRIFRDPIAKRIARMTEAMRAPRAVASGSQAVGDHLVADVVEPGPEAFLPEQAALVRERGARWHARLVRLRATVAFLLVTLLSFAVLEISTWESGLREGLLRAVTSWYGMAIVLLLAACAVLQRLGLPLIKTIDAYVLGAFVRTLVAILAALLLLNVVIEYVGLAGSILQNKIPFSRVLEFYLQLSPSMFLQLLPWAVMVAALAAFGVLTKFNEVTALRVCGVSVFRLAVPVVLVAAVLSGVSFVLRDYVLPQANQEAERLRAELKGRASSRQSTARGLLFAMDGGGLYHFDRYLPAQTIVPAGAPPVPVAQRQPQILNLTILRWDHAGGVRALTCARDAAWTGERWELHAGWTATLGEIDGRPQVETLERFDSRPVPEMERPDYFGATREDPDQMTFAEFARYIEEQEAAGYPTHELQVQLHAKVADPLRGVVLLLVGLPFAFTTGRHGALYGFGVAVIVAVAFFVVVALFQALGAAEYLPPVAAAWAPNALFSVAGVYLLLHVRT